ncbi:hypothetical protein NNJEOMEG_00716 [Fundidesulfovibrio magnetotacticus]|uniref:Xylose isomerase-like TIM barrel domain-containing protein n=1 Tax=Fundidesulfovibrio magnetotacticus TaxID=2730080 RepID=A0A6V8LRC0_9BACT|nr:sugar phosphate isomerase/epimerase family protein [Fundidesulfovibrio magnetotacticus]GFK92888.1 hypothetical protein NNJEOMEG_00716 [Fundidesulfovibrio magnetotacticus]
MVFVSLNLRAAAADPARLERFLALGLNPELGLDPLCMDTVAPAWHEALAARLKSLGLRCGLHLPFFDLQPGSADSLVRRATAERLKRAVETARVYGAVHLVGHARYDHLLYVRSEDAWRERAVETWAEALSAWPGHPPLWLENTYEPHPGPVAAMAEALDAAIPGRAGLCLDAGHWFSFARGREQDDLQRWLDAFAPSLGHLHLHDNDGSADQHLGMGDGFMDWEAFFQALEARGLAPTATYEAHTEETLAVTLRYLRERGPAPAVRRVSV